MAGETTVQSPAIGNALRQALSLDAAGSMGMEAGLTVHPVCIVGDIRAQLGSNVRSFSGYRNVAAVAAQFGKVALQCPVRALAGRLRYAVPRQIRIYVGGGAIYWRLGSSTVPPAIDAISRGLITPADASGVCSVVGGADGAGVSTGIQQGLILTGANQVLWDPPEMRLVPDASTQMSLTFSADTALTLIIAEIIWDEYYSE